MEEQKYIEFLRFCLNPQSSIPDCVNNINWHNLLKFAKKQTIVGVYWQGIQRLGDIANKPSEDDVMEWMGEYQKITRRNSKVDGAIVKLTMFLNDNNIGFFVFKGQAVARCYPKPEMRTSGDVDFYVFKKDWDRAKKLLGTKVKIDNAHSFRHLEFSYDGIPFEMHYHTTVFASNSKQRYWDDLIDSYFDDVLDHVEINGVSVPTLPPTINAIYLFIHIYHHFLKEGIALRQFIDWMMFFEAKHDEIVVSELSAKLEKLGLLRAFKAFGAVLVDVLGMRSTQTLSSTPTLLEKEGEKSSIPNPSLKRKGGSVPVFPLEITDEDRKYEEKIMSIVLKYGNFGKYGRSTPTLLKKEGVKGGRLASWWHSLETGLRSVRHLTQFFWLSPSENLLWLPKLIKHSIIKNSRSTPTLLKKEGEKRSIPVP